jgi:hypothetical protein
VRSRELQRRLNDASPRQEKRERGTQQGEAVIIIIITNEKKTLGCPRAVLS